MRGQLLIAVVLGVIVIGMATPLIKSLLPHAKECMNEFEEEDYTSLALRGNLDSDNFHRLKCCLWNKAGLMKDAKMNIPVLEEVLMGGDDSEKRPAVLNIMKECQAESEVSDDTCVVLKNYLTCYRSKSHG